MCKDRILCSLDFFYSSVVPHMTRMIYVQKVVCTLGREVEGKGVEEVDGRILPFMQETKVSPFN